MAAEQVLSGSVVDRVRRPYETQGRRRCTVGIALAGCAALSDHIERTQRQVPNIAEPAEQFRSLGILVQRGVSGGRNSVSERRSVIAHHLVGGAAVEVVVLHRFVQPRDDVVPLFRCEKRVAPIVQERHLSGELAALESGPMLVASVQLDESPDPARAILTVLVQFRRRQRPGGIEHFPLAVDGLAGDQAGEQIRDPQVRLHCGRGNVGMRFQPVVETLP